MDSNQNSTPIIFLNAGTITLQSNVSLTFIEIELVVNLSSTQNYVFFKNDAFLLNFQVCIFFSLLLI